MTENDKITELDLIVAQNVHNLRKTKKLSQEDLAHEMDITQGLISKLEKGKRAWRVYYVHDAAKALQVPPYQLMIEGMGEINLEYADKIRDLDDKKRQALFTILDNAID